MWPCGKKERRNEDTQVLLPKYYSAHQSIDKSSDGFSLVPVEREFAELFHTLPERRDKLALMNLLNRAVRKSVACVPGEWPRTRHVFGNTYALLFAVEFMMAFAKVNAWTCAVDLFGGSDYEDPKIAALFGGFLLIPQFLSLVAQRWNIKTEEQDTKRWLENTLLQFGTTSLLPIAYRHGIIAFPAQQDFEEALLPCLMMGCYLVMVEKIAPSVWRLVLMFMKNVLKAIMKLFSGICPSLCSPSEGVNEVNILHVVSQKRSCINHKKVEKILARYQSIPEIFLGLIVFIFVLFGLCTKDRVAIGHDLGTNNSYALGNFFTPLCVGAAILICRLQALLEKE